MKKPISYKTIAQAITMFTLLTSQALALNCGAVKVVMTNLSANPAYVAQANGTRIAWNSGEGTQAIADVSPYYVECKLDLVVNNKIISGLVPENTTPANEVDIRINPDGTIISNGIDLTLNDQISQYGLKTALGLDRT